MFLTLIFRSDDDPTPAPPVWPDWNPVFQFLPEDLLRVHHCICGSADGDFHQTYAMIFKGVVEEKRTGKSTPANTPAQTSDLSSLEMPMLEDLNQDLNEDGEQGDAI